MANTKKTTTAKPETEETVDVKIENDSVETDNDSEVEILKKQLADLQALMIKMQNTQPSTISTFVSEDDTVYEIGTRFVNGVGIYSPDKRVVKEIQYGKTVSVDGSELRELLKSNFVKDWFESDLIYFIDESAYEKKRIHRRFSLDNEPFIDLVMNNPTDFVVKKFNEMTRNFKDEPVVHCIFYRIIELSYEGDLSKMPYETRRKIEELFRFKIDDAQMLFRGFKEIK